MVVGSTKGGKSYKKTKSSVSIEVTDKLISKKDFDGCIYAKVIQMSGGDRLIAQGEDRKQYCCVIRGKLYKKIWIGKDDYLIVCPRTYEKKNTADVVHKMSQNEIFNDNVDEIFSNILIEQERKDNNDEFIFDNTNTTNSSTMNFDDVWENL